MLRRPEFYKHERNQLLGGRAFGAAVPFLGAAEDLSADQEITPALYADNGR